MIYDHLVSNDLSPQSITITKELRDSVGKAHSRWVKIEKGHARKVTRNFGK